ncbi:MAG: hypothetical protein R2875_14310 [Desulfobacterales bacterium]
MEKCIDNARRIFIGLVVISMCLILPTGNGMAAEKVIKIGVMGPMQFIYGQLPWNGAQMAADEINAAGGVRANGVPHTIELIQADDNCLKSVPDAISAMERLITVKKKSIL